MFRRWFRGVAHGPFATSGPRRKGSCGQLGSQPRFEPLEDRLAPAVHIWDGEATWGVRGEKSDGQEFANQWASRRMGRSAGNIFRSSILRGRFALLLHWGVRVS